MLLQLMKRLQIIVWLLLTFNLTLLYSTILSTVTLITPTLAAAETVTISSTAALASATTTTFKSSSPSTTSSSVSNHNRRLHLHLEHHQYTQQQYPASYQNYPLTPHIATEFMDEFHSPNQAGKFFNIWQKLLVII
ncbi:uncharacterized protein LOC119612050 [Lucilia sericata]|uniref:uncharacterized protein LOC119612050 n=1 Tax=Lucilia sericata TaxID=13632 RepID=UPI0018A87428|nr:uncharacterized protein LOC119612050 [Lucilia sericata]